MKRLMPVVLAVTIGACGDDGNATKKDAAIDGPPDAPAQVQLMGEYVDWDSNDGAGFCGILGATWTLHDDPTVTDSTPPNGRIMMMVSGAGISRIDITPPTMPSGCTTAAMNGTYAVPGIALADPAVIATGQLISARAWTTMRQATLGFTFDPTKAYVFVHVDKTPAAVSLSSTHDAAQAFDGTSWTAGTTGVNVIFPGIDPTAGTTTVTMGGATGQGSVPIEAGTVTYVTVVGS